MDARERVLTTLNHEEPDRIPSFEASIDNLAICNHYGVKYSFQGAGKALKNAYKLFFGSEKLLTKVLKFLAKRKFSVKFSIKPMCDLYRKIGLDLLCIPIALYPEKYFKTGYIDEYGRKFEFKKNPADDMDISYYMGGTFKDFEDYESFPPLDPDNPTREKAFKLMKQIQEDYNNEVFMIPAMFGMMEPTWEAFGLENFSRMLAKPEHVKQIFDDRGQFAVELVKRLIEWGERDALLIYDDYGYKAGLFMSPRNYRKYVIPWLKRICDTAHKEGIKVLLHSCGDDYLILEDIINAGVDGLHPIEPTTANEEYDIFKLKEQYGDKITFIGNVSPQDLSDKDPSDIKQYTKRLIDKVAPGGGFILSSGHSINPAVKLENFLAMLETLDKYGSYPIS